MYDVLNILGSCFHPSVIIHRNPKTGVLLVAEMSQYPALLRVWYTATYDCDWKRGVSPLMQTPVAILYNVTHLEKAEKLKGCVYFSEL